MLAGREFVSLAEREDALLRDLFQGYQRWVRPVLHANHTVKVRFGLKISQLVDVVRQTYRSSYFGSLTLMVLGWSLSMVLKYSSWSSPWFWTPLTYEVNTSLFIRHTLGASASLESIYRKYCSPPSFFPILLVLFCLALSLKGFCCSEYSYDGRLNY